MKPLLLSTLAIALLCGCSDVVLLKTLTGPARCTAPVNGACASCETACPSLKQETAQPPRPSLPAQQRAFDRFRRLYNEERPHEALAQQPPATRYAPSPRPVEDCNRTRSPAPEGTSAQPAQHAPMAAASASSKTRAATNSLSVG